MSDEVEGRRASPRRRPADHAYRGARPSHDERGTTAFSRATTTPGATDVSRGLESPARGTRRAAGRLLPPEASRPDAGAGPAPPGPAPPPAAAVAPPKRVYHPRLSPSGALKVAPTAQKVRSIPTTWVSQFSLSDDRAKAQKLCFDAAAAMTLEKSPVPIALDRYDRIQIAEGTTDDEGRIKTIKGQAEKARRYIDQLLDRNVRAMAAISSAPNHSVEYPDHYVTIYARGYDVDGRVFYEYLDPGTRRPERSRGKLYVDEKTSILFKNGAAPTEAAAVLRDYEVSHVRTFKSIPPK